MIQTLIYLIIILPFFIYDHNRKNKLDGYGNAFWIGFFLSVLFILHLLLFLANGFTYSSLLNQRQAIEKSNQLDETAISLKKIEYNIELMAAQNHNKNFFLEPYISDRVDDLDFLFE